MRPTSVRQIGAAAGMRTRHRAVLVALILGAAIAFPLGVLASHQFSDVPDSNPYHADIDALVDSGVTTGCGGGKYCPSAFVTRGEMAAFMNRLGALQAGKTPVVNADKIDGLDSTDLLGGGSGMGDVVAAGRVGALGGLTTPPQFGTTGVAVTHVATGIYQLTFPGYDQSHRYVVTGSPVTSFPGAPQLLETLVGDVATPLDPSNGLFVRISSITGTAVDSAFTFQVTDFTAAP